MVACWLLGVLVATGVWVGVGCGIRRVWPTERFVQSADNPFSVTMLMTEVLKVKAMARQVSFSCTVYENGVGDGSGEAVRVGNANVGVVVG